MNLVEHAVQPLQDEDEGGPHGLRRPVGDGQHLHDVAAQPSALHGQGVVGGELQQGVGNLCQPAEPRGATSCLSNIGLQNVPGHRPVLSSPHVRLDVQQLKCRDPWLARDVLQDFEPRSAVLIEFCADVQEGLSRSTELFPGDALVQLLPGHPLALFQQMEVIPARRQSSVRPAAQPDFPVLFCVSDLVLTPPDMA